MATNATNSTTRVGKQGHPKERREEHCNNTEVTKKPNPCAPPEDKDKDCGCAKPPGHIPDQPRQPRQPRRPSDDC